MSSETRPATGAADAATRDAASLPTLGLPATRAEVDLTRRTLLSSEASP